MQINLNYNMASYRYNYKSYKICILFISLFYFTPYCVNVLPAERMIYILFRVFSIFEPEIPLSTRAGKKFKKL